VAESDRLLSDCTPFKGVPRVRIPLSPPVISLRVSVSYFFQTTIFCVAVK
jgi:hypothetical protein